MLVLVPFVVSMMVVMAFMPLLARFAGRLRMVDAPAARKVHAAPIPRVGGIAMAAGVLAAFSVIRVDWTTNELAFAGGALIIFAFGVLDDRLDLNYRVKFGAQIAACGVVAFAGGLQLHTLYLPGLIVVPAWLGGALTLLYMVGITNAVNLADGLDGLAGGTAFLCFCGLAWISYVGGGAFGVDVCVAFAGAVVGFLRFNTHPALVFMGDSGSQLLGYAIGGLGLFCTQSGAVPFATTLPLLLLAVPIIDTLQVMVRRALAGSSPFRPDRRHLHHRLLSAGLAHHQAVMVIYGLQAVLLVVSYLLRKESDLVILATFAAFACAILLPLEWIERTGWRVPDTGASAAVSDPTFAHFLGREALLRASLRVLGVALILYLAFTTLDALPMPRDFQVAVWVLGALMIVRLAFARQAPLTFSDKGMFYATGAAFVAVDTAVPAGARTVPFLDFALMVCVGLSTVVALRSNRARSFGVTPLDILVLFVTLVIPNLPDFNLLPSVVPLALAKVVVLCYGLEVVSTVEPVNAGTVRIVGVLGLVALGVQLGWLGS